MAAAGEQQDEQQEQDGEGNDPRHLHPAWGASIRAGIGARSLLGVEGVSHGRVLFRQEDCTPSTLIETLCLCQARVLRYRRRV